jgi:V/A-type H+-transporting ATPase subunit E
MTDQKTTSGVQELIDKLSEEGVAEGEQRAEKIVSEARQQADEIVESARRQATEIVRKGRDEAEQYQAAGEEALRLAARDAVRDFGANIHDGLRNRLQELVRHNLKEPDLIKRMILEVTRRATEGLEDESKELLLPLDIITEEEARRRIEDGEQDVLIDFVQGLIGEDLREGTKYGSQHPSGITVRVVDQNIEIDLTDASIGDLLAQHLLPRFRAIMRKA